MKEIILKQPVLFFLLFTLSGCSLLDFLKDDEEPKQSTKQLLVIDTEDETPFDCVLFNEDNHVTTFFNFHENNIVSQAIIKFNDTDENLIVSVSEDGKIESLGDGDCTLTFYYKEENKVDVAIIIDDETYIYENLTAPEESTEYLSRGTFDDFADWVEGWSFNRGLYEFSETWGGIIGIQTELVGLTSDGINDVLTPKNAIKRFVEMAISAFGYLPGYVMDTVSVATIFDAPGPWGKLLNLILNYSSYVDWCENTFSKIIPLLEKHDEETNIGLGSLKSGIGQLKATLTWSFYADIDLHAFEPSGTHIYYLNKYGDYGYLDYDNRRGGAGAMENIYWKSPAPGKYEFYINYYGESTYNDLAQSGICHVSIYYNNQGKKYDIPLSSGDAYVATITVAPSSGVRSTLTPEIRIRPLEASDDKTHIIRDNNK